MIPGLETRKTVGKRQIVSQFDIPGFSLDHALQVPSALLDSFAGQATPPARLASAINLLAISNQFRMLTESAIAYGLTEGSAQSSEIGLTELAQRILRPISEEDALEARRQALLKPRIVGEFLRRYDGSPVPPISIAEKMLSDMGVPRGVASKAYEFIVKDARALGMVDTIDGRNIVVVDGIRGEDAEALNERRDDGLQEIVDHEAHEISAQLINRLQANAKEAEERELRVFLPRDLADDLLSPIRKLLGFAGLIGDSGDGTRLSDSDRMAQCSHGLLIVDQVQKFLDPDLEEVALPLTTDLLSIGAARFLYSERLILLVKQGITLPEELSGITQLAFNGKTLDGDTTIQLMEALQALRARPETAH